MPNPPTLFRLRLFWLLAVLLSGVAFVRASYAAPSSLPSTQITQRETYLPLLLNGEGAPIVTAGGRRVYAPFFSGSINVPETAIFWFGQVTSDQNYTDVRVGYTNDELYVYLAAFDRRLWYDTTPTGAELTEWDSASLYLDTAGNTGSSPAATSYRFDAQLQNDGFPSIAPHAAYRGNGSAWISANVEFIPYAGWRGVTINDDTDDRGWAMTYHIPWVSLGLAAPPAMGTIWGLGVTLHDRDSAAGPPQVDTSWPEGMNPASPGAWGQWIFGLPVYMPPPAATGGTAIIVQGQNGVITPDGDVGGHTTCGAGMDYWTQWGERVYDGYGEFNVQNQSDISDWPCFSKYYITFPLNTLPAGKIILSATLTLHQMGQAGLPGSSPDSFVQVLTVSEDWNETGLSWNNAPYAEQNITGEWVPGDMVGCGSTLPWPCTPRTWDISRAVAEAYASGAPLRLVLYSADNSQHSGRYFISADTGDWNIAGRPVLTVVWGNP